MPNSELIWQGLLGLLIAVPTSYLTARFTLQRFRQEKWWEAKRSSYLAIFEALHHLKRVEEKSRRQLLHPEAESDIPTEKSTEEYQRHSAELEKQIDLASFQLSDESVSLLDTFVNERRQAYRDDPDGINGLESIALSRCLASLKVAARNDLGAIS